MLFEATGLAVLCYSIKRILIQGDYKIEKRMKSFPIRGTTQGRLSLNIHGAKINVGWLPGFGRYMELIPETSGT